MEISAGLRPQIGSSSIRAQREVIAAGGGIGMPPCFMAADLVPIQTERVVLTRRFWISRHTDVGGAPHASGPSEGG